MSVGGLSVEDPLATMAWPALDTSPLHRLSLRLRG